MLFLKPRSLDLSRLKFLCKFLIWFIIVYSAAYSLQAQRIYLVDGYKAANNTAIALNRVTLSDWNKACNNLQTAIDSSKAGDQIWIKNGTYLPSKDTSGNEPTPANKKLSTFNIRNGIKLYGGFSGEETSIDSRRLAVFTTTLTGDFGNNSQAYNVIYFHHTDKSTVIDGLTITGGIAENGRNGGGILCDSSQAIISNCIVTGNSSSQHGGGMYSLNSTPTLVNCVFTLNTAASGAAMYNSNSSPVVVNCTVGGNRSTKLGGGIFNDFTSTPLISNSILWGNTGNANTFDNLYNSNASSPSVVNYSIIGQLSGNYSGTKNLNRNPLFVSATRGNLHYVAGSPAVNAGSNSAYVPALSSTDLWGYPRMAGTIDMGAYEGSDLPYGINAKILYVDSSNSNVSGNGISWAEAFTSLADALHVINSSPLVFPNGNIQVWVAKGTYFPAYDLNGNISPSDTRDLTFTVKNAVMVYGGFNGTETSLGQRNYKDNITILSGLMPEASYPINVYNVVSVMPTRNIPRLDGLTISDGVANYVHGGGGVYVNRTSVVIENCRIINNGNGGGIYNLYGNINVKSCFFSNNMNQNGGAIFNLVGSGTISECTFIDNSGTEIYGFGGAIANQNSSPSISNCSFINNTANSAGGAIYNNDNSSPTLYNCKFIGNSSFPNGRGGAIVNTLGCNPVIVNCVFSKNIAGTAGAISHSGGNMATLINCSISNNSAYYSGGVSNVSPSYFASTIKISNSIIWGNHSFLDSGINNLYTTDDYPTNTNFIVNNSIIGNFRLQGQAPPIFPGVNNSSADPKFIDTTNGILELQGGSSAIDAGDNSSYLGKLQSDSDIRGSRRLTGSSIDIGAYETFNSILPIVLLDFYGAKEYNSNHIQWVTTQEVNAKLFVIQRSYDGKNFRAIQTVPVKNQAGLIAKDYSFHDPNSGFSCYYRLQMIDDDGSFDYSKVIFIDRVVYEELTIKLVSNFAGSSLDYIVSGKEGLNYNVSLLDFTGKILVNQNHISGNKVQHMETGTLPHGLYLLQCLEQKSGQKVISKIIKK